MYHARAQLHLFKHRTPGYDRNGSTAVDEHDAPNRLEHLVTAEDYRELLQLADRVIAECAALQHTRLLTEFHEVE
jgi:hypothetical protein